MRSLCAALCLVLLVTTASAVPPGTQVVTDPAGDAGQGIDGGLFFRSMDLTGLRYHSDGTDMTVTFQLVDLHDHAPPAMYTHEFLASNATDEWMVQVTCRHGSYGLPQGAVDATLGNVHGVRDCGIDIFTFTWNSSGTVRSETQYKSTPALVQFDTVADTVSTTFPYGAMNGTAGLTLEPTRTATSYAPAWSIGFIGDSAFGGSTYTLA